jgi:hypothetical protein
MSINPDNDQLVKLHPSLDGTQAGRSLPVEALPVTQPETRHAAPPAAAVAVPGLYEPAPVVAPGTPEAQPSWGVAPQTNMAPVRTRGRRGWVGAVAVGAIGLIAAGTLGYFLYSTSGQRDAALRRVASTQATLTATQGTLTSTQEDLAARKATAAYVSMYIADTGRVRIDYQKLVACTTFGPCRTAAQAALSDLQTFQADRSAAAITALPTALADSDGMLRSALSAAIAADQELVSGLDNFNANKIKSGFHKLNAAMLSVAKAEAVLGAELK